jgi:lipid-binding SYLF domain-containing protein
MSKLTISILFICTTQAFAETEAQRLNTAAQVLTDMTTSKDSSIPTDLLQKSHCAVVIPSLKKAGFIFSGKYGRGFASCRNSSGAWSAPAAMRVEGGGFGLQIGGEDVDIVMLVMSQKGMDGLLASKFTLGADASVAAGPVGRDASAQTDATLKADILSWSKSKGVFGGLALQGGTLRVDNDGDKELYGRSVTGTDILTSKVQAPTSASAFLSALTRSGGTGRKG